MRRQAAAKGAVLALLVALLGGGPAVRAQDAASGVDAPAAVDDPRADAVVAFFAGLNSLKARFVEITADGRRREGLFLWQRPGRFRFSYTDGTPLLIVSDGRQVSLVDEEAGSVSRWPVAETVLAPLLARRPDPEELRQAIRAIHDGPVSGLFWVEVADPAHPERGPALLLFSERDGGLAWLGWRVPDGRGGVIELRLFDAETDVEIAESAWEFADPRRAVRRKRRGM